MQTTTKNEIRVSYQTSKSKERAFKSWERAVVQEELFCQIKMMFFIELVRYALTLDNQQLEELVRFFEAE